MKQQNNNNDRKRRMLLVFPVLVFPFATLIFWALGGGSGGAAKGAEQKRGLNLEVPSANNVEEPADKMGFYSQAEKQEMERAKLMKNDPYSQMGFDTAALDGQHAGGIDRFGRMEVASGTSGQMEDPNEKRLYQKLAALQQSLKEPAAPEVVSSPRARYQTEQAPVNAEMQRLEEMMQRMNDQQPAEDPQMKQVNAVLENILDLQHPERVQQRIKKTSELNRGSVYPVSLPGEDNPVSTLAVPDRRGSVPMGSNGFFGLDQVSEQPADAASRAIRAVVHQSQTLVNGSTVKLRLLDPVFINGTFLPKDQFVYGTANLSGERLTVSIESIRYLSQLFPVELGVYDMDGMEGIYIPGAISREVAKQGADRSVQNLGLSTFDPSFGAQAASAGIEISKNLFSKKVKLVKVQVKSGYQVMLLDLKQQKNK
ncbi:conjugative transposon protein TraM [Pedobacter chitinilyticus]|uniref:Conjugative transposon protein TraM n=1 Tax=Pedobacter chitinilyticus TaxID=2233776 RepID=A0A3S4RR30_9SPHI|nr:conjugative transposon protein TraM [Pedobacter chitinilyticus]RWU08127.1 conjugative transposon protein TraM [Pedobacter chitinilyticus]